MARKRTPSVSRIVCKCGSEGPVKNRFNLCACKDLDKPEKKTQLFDAIFIESVKN